MLWDVLSEHGVTTNLFSLHNTWPSEPNAEIVLTEEGAHILGDVFFEIVESSEFDKIQLLPASLYRGIHLPGSFIEDLFTEDVLENQQPTYTHSWSQFLPTQW